MALKQHRRRSRRGSQRSTEVLGLRITPDLKDWLSAKAAKRGQSLSDYVRDVLESSESSPDIQRSLSVAERVRKAREEYARDLHEAYNELLDIGIGDQKIKRHGRKNE